MAYNSKIEWTDHTANLWHGCTKVHEGCDNCYAETIAKRWGNDIWGIDKPRKEIKSVWNDLEKYQRLAKHSGVIHRVFVGSMMDVFEKPMPLIHASIPEYTTDVLRSRLFDFISSGYYPNLMFLFLTKRPSNINKYIPIEWINNPPLNVMFGTSPVNQQTADKLIPQLLRIKGKRFLSIEPQIAHVDIRKYLSVKDNISWVIQGGESGHNKRSFSLGWAYDMKIQCENAGVPYFFKQIDKIQPIPEDLQIQQNPF